MEAIKLCRLDTPIIFIEARINLSRFVVTGCAAKTSATVTFPSLNLISDRKSGSAGMPRPISYAVFCLKKKKKKKLKNKKYKKLCVKYMFYLVLLLTTVFSLLTSLFFFFFNATAPTDIYTLSLHDALPICRLDTPIIFIEARINLSRFVVTGCAAKTSATVTFPSLNLISLFAFCFNIWLNGVAS